MDFSNPFGTLVPRKMSNRELGRAIMQDIAAELDAVALYQAHIDATDDERAKAVLAHVRDEEKEHAAEFITLLAMLDPTQARELEEAHEGVAQILREAGVRPQTEETGYGEQGDGEQEQPAGQPSSLTVGSLVGRETGA